MVSRSFIKLLFLCTFYVYIICCFCALKTYRFRVEYQTFRTCQRVCNAIHAKVKFITYLKYKVSYNIESVESLNKMIENSLIHIHVKDMYRRILMYKITILSRAKLSWICPLKLISSIAICCKGK